jgi:hypothetical protein
LGSVVFEDILRSPCKKSQVLGQLGLQETITVAAWYIWWQRQQAVKGENMAPAGHYKLNVDASYFHSGMAAVAAVVQTPK